MHIDIHRKRNTQQNLERAFSIVFIQLFKILHAKTIF